jgi:lipoyl(octanoyl) transferase
MLNMRGRNFGVKSLVMRLEQSVIDLLAEYGITSGRQTGMPGVYVVTDGVVAKIAAIGLRVANHATYHGLSLNINMDLEPFSRINPCGYAGLATTQLSALGVRDNTQVVGEKLLTHMKANLYG